MTFFITRDVPAVEVDDISWSYNTNKDPEFTIDVATLLISNRSKYRLSDNLRTLTVFNLSLSDGGFFTLSAANEAGISTATQELVIHGEYGCMQCKPHTVQAGNCFTAPTVVQKFSS
jgi:hypothetical protein